MKVCYEVTSEEAFIKVFIVLLITITLSKIIIAGMIWHMTAGARSHWKMLQFSKYWGSRWKIMVLRGKNLKYKCEE